MLRARDVAAGPAAVVATIAPTHQKVPLAKAVTTRVASTRAKDDLSAATRWPRAKTTSARTGVKRRGRCSVAIAIAGALGGQHQDDEGQGVGPVVVRG